MKFLCYFLISFLSACSIVDADDGMEDGTPKELAQYMAELQVLTHKLGLSVEAENRALISFYLHESLVKIEEIQKDLPEYEGIPVALYLDRMALPVYKQFRKQYDAPVESEDYFKHLDVAYDALIATCNACHATAGWPYLRIKRNAKNPYLQDFTPMPTANK